MRQKERGGKEHEKGSLLCEQTDRNKTKLKGIICFRIVSYRIVYYRNSLIIEGKSKNDILSEIKIFETASRGVIV